MYNMARQREGLSAPYVVLIGDIGNGKSTLVEMLTGRQNLSSRSSESFTKCALRYQSQMLDICDTPGSNPMDKRYEHNVWIATAMSDRPVSALLIIVQAHQRKNNVIEKITGYAEAFEPQEFNDIVAACVTHMDEVDWTETEFRADLERQTGITKVIFSQPSKPAARLESDILSICHVPPVNIEVNGDNFLRFFKFNDSTYKIMQSVRREVTRFEKIKKKFYEQNPILKRDGVDRQSLESHNIDLLFEFQAWMTRSITEAQERVGRANNFSFQGPSWANEMGHIANLSNRLKTVLLELRMRCLHFHSSHGVNEMRRCPHCGTVWTKVIGCEGATTCGNLVQGLDLRAGSSGVMATFTFAWDDRQERLTIQRTGDRTAQQVQARGAAVGCGQSITWSSMPLVTVPEEFTAAQEASVDDVKALPNRVAERFERNYEMDRRHYQIRDGSEVREALRRPIPETANFTQQIAYEMDGFLS